MQRSINSVSKEDKIYYAYSVEFLSQMATYWFVIDDLDIWKAQKSEVRQAANDVVKSEV